MLRRMLRKSFLYLPLCLGIFAPLLEAVVKIDDISLSQAVIDYSSEAVDITVTVGGDNVGDRGDVTIRLRKSTKPDQIIYTFPTFPNKVKGDVFTHTWDGAYPLAGEMGKTNGIFFIDVIASTGTYNHTISTQIAVEIMDIHRVKIQPTPLGTTNQILVAPYLISYYLSKDATEVQVDIKDSDGNLMRRFLNPGNNGETEQENVVNYLNWDGKDSNGRPAAKGFYTVTITAEDNSLPADDAVPQIRSVSVDPLRIISIETVPLTTTNPQASIRYQLSEDMNVVLGIFSPGTTFDESDYPLDENGSWNFARLVRSFSGTRPGRQTISEVWDGLDNFGKEMPDGVYVYLLKASDSYGNQASDRIIGTVSVLRTLNDFIDKESAFRENAFLYPNPFRIGETLTLSFPIFRDPSQMNLQLYTLDGQLLWEKEEVIKNLPAGIANLGVQINYTWDGKNEAGKYLARGIYFWVIRVKDNDDVLQTVEKMVILPKR